MGIQFLTIYPGDGEHFPQKGQTAQVHFEIFLPDQTKVDSTLDRDQLFIFKVGNREVIRGIDEGVLEMSVGQKAKLTVSADYAYGPDGLDDLVPPNSSLVIELELFSFLNSPNYLTAFTTHLCIFRKTT